ncbi:MAG: hypothetical protein HGA28_08265 [Anaerolineaceae bacterium]|nr:hypothetical protein [Anaerolineaceae bacterium]
MKTLIKNLIIVFVIALVLSQLQPLLLRSVGAVNGSFGLRPISHKCLGVTLGGPQRTSALPDGDVEFELGLFLFRYFVREEDKLGERPMCLGQDLWFGE